MRTELEETEKRELEIQDEKKVIKEDSKICAEKAALLKVYLFLIYLANLNVRKSTFEYLIFHLKLQHGIDEKQARFDKLQEEHKNFMQQVNKIKESKLKDEQKLEIIEKKLNDTKQDIPVVQNKVCFYVINEIFENIIFKSFFLEHFLVYCI